MDFYPAQILLPIGWTRPRRAHYAVTDRTKGAVQIKYREDIFEMRIQGQLLNRHLSLSFKGETVGGVAWSESRAEVALNGLRVKPAYQGRGLGNLLAWAALKLARELGCIFERGRAQGVMEEVEDETADPRAAPLFVKMGFHCLEPGVLEETIDLITTNCEIEVCGSNKFPHLRMESPTFGIIRVALMTHEGSMTKQGPSRGILQERTHYQFVTDYDYRKNLSDVISRGAAYLSGDYWLDSQYAGLLIEEIDQMPALGI
jgi:GNAT superfamily N-acetyltransferase